ncbi:hypothetical protein C8J57DRAFT_1732772 [Mycena rebaudengoi]|nr:hypothetical protein C8J57DRAFT_1732772 [Mycena rebaudengoi]
MRFHACRPILAPVAYAQFHWLSGTQAGVTNPAVLPTTNSPQPGPVDLTAVLEVMDSEAAEMPGKPSDRAPPPVRDRVALAWADAPRRSAPAGRPVAHLQGGLPVLRPSSSVLL